MNTLFSHCRPPLIRRVIVRSCTQSPLHCNQVQTDSVGIPLHAIEYDPEDEIKGYENAVLKAINHYKKRGTNHFLFGDIFLHDVRSYLKKQLNPHGIEVVEPLC